MLKRQLSRSASICDGFRQRNFIHLGRGFLPLLAVILLAAPSLAFANGLTVTVSPRTLDITEPDTTDGDGTADPSNGIANGNYTVTLDSTPTEEVKITVHGAAHTASRASDAVGGIGVESDGFSGK